MGGRLRKFLRPVPVGLTIASVLAASALVAFGRTDTSVEKPGESRAAGAVMLPSDDPDLPALSASPSSTPSPKVAPKPKPKPKSKAVAPTRNVFRGLGTWIDIYDYSLNPSTTAREMRSRGVQTLYIQTGRYNLPGTFKDTAALGSWLDAAHANSIKVVGWYLPGYGDLERDVKRTVAVATFRSPNGGTFDGIGVDIEDKCEIESSSPCKSAPHVAGMTQADWNAAIVTHAARVRAAVGSKYALAAIPPPPLAMEIRPSHWTGFPWQQLPASFDVIMPMAYWSYRDDCSARPEHCPYGYTKGNIEAVRALTGNATIPVHSIGGVADVITDAEVADYVRACADARSFGGSLYDYRTTSASAWKRLASLRAS